MKAINTAAMREKLAEAEARAMHLSRWKDKGSQKEYQQLMTVEIPCLRNLLKIAEDYNAVAAGKSPDSVSLLKIAELLKQLR